MYVDSIALHDVALVQTDGTPGRVLIVEASNGEQSGWAEAGIAPSPWSGAEFLDSAWTFATEYAIPHLLANSPAHPSGSSVRLEGLQGHPRTKMAIELALWDLYARTHAFPMIDALGGGKEFLRIRTKIPVTDTTDELEDAAGAAISQGASVLQIAIRPGWDLEPLQAIRRRYPLIGISAEAAGSYDLAEASRLTTLEGLELDAVLDPFSRRDRMSASAGDVGGLWWTVEGWDDVRAAERHRRSSRQLGGVEGIVILADAFGGYRELLDVAAFANDGGLSTLLGTSGSTVLAAGQTALLAAATGIELAPVSHLFTRWGRDVIKPGWISGPHGLRLPTGVGNGLEIDRPFLRRQARRHTIVTG